MITYRKISSGFKTENNIGLGNQMFFMAAVIGLADRHRLSYGYELFYPEVFPNQAPVYAKDKPFIIVPWGYHDIPIRDGQAIYGYVQSEKYFKHCRDKVLWQFEMKPQSNIELASDAVCIHVRRGDYVNSRHHYCLGMEYYEKAMEQITGTYYVFSDDILYCKEMFRDKNVIFVNGRDVFEDFFLMRQCKKFIIANSSLSWWAAWMTGGETIAPKNWFAGVNQHLETKDLYCEGWSII